MLLCQKLARLGKCLLRCSSPPLSFHLLLTLLFSSGSAVDQSPDMIVRGDERITLRCSQLKTQFSYMYWYKQERKKDARLQLVIYSREGAGDRFPVEKEFKDHFESPGMNGYALNLTLKEAKPSDTGTYFCAKQDHTVRWLHRKPDTNPFTGECMCT